MTKMTTETVIYILIMTLRSIEYNQIVTWTASQFLRCFKLGPHRKFLEKYFIHMLVLNKNIFDPSSMEKKVNSFNSCCWDVIYLRKSLILHNRTAGGFLPSCKIQLCFWYFLISSTLPAGRGSQGAGLIKIGKGLSCWFKFQNFSARLAFRHFPLLFP